MTECSTCGFPLEEDDRFCGNCRAAVADSAEQARIEPETLTVKEALDSEGTQKSPGGETGFPSPRGKNPVVEFNASRVLLEGSVLPLEFRIQDSVSDLLISVESVNGIRAQRTMAQIHPGEEILLDTPVPKGCCGTLGFEVSLQYTLNGKRSELRGTCRHEICPAAGDGNVHIDIQQGHAGDIQVAGLRELAARSDKRVLLRELAAIEPRWEVLPIRGVSEKELEPGRHERQRVDTPSGPVHLLTGNCLTFGRSRDNDIVTRLTRLPSGLLDPANSANPNRYISSRHGWLHHTGEGVFVVDGDMVTGKPSGGGTFLDGKPITRQKLPAASVLLSLSGADASVPAVYSLRISVREGGVVFQLPDRHDGVFLWLFGSLDFEGASYETRPDGFYIDGEKADEKES
jgi:hypothetical protein